MDRRFSQVRALLATVLALAACADFPEDPRNTLDRARNGRLRVGVTESRPWLTREDSVAGGLEAELIRGFAETIDADVEWVWGTQEAHMEALSAFELDLVAGGLVAGTPWSSHVGLTRPYAKERWAVGVPPGARIPEELEGLEIAVPQEGAVAAWVREKGAEPVRIADLARAAGPVAAPVWKLRELGYRPTDHTLHTVRHVLAVPPGENGLLVELERHLHRVRRAGGTGAPR